MTCAEFEIQLCDYLDGTLSPAERQALEAHRDQCAGCRQFALDVAGAVAFIERAAEVEPPPELLTRISFEIPTGRTHAAKRPGVLSLAAGWFRPVLQPKFAMGMAMTIVSFSLLGRFAGIEPRQLRASDLSPSAVWAAAEDRLHKGWDRVIRYYEGLKVVYDIQTRLREMREQDDDRVKAETQTAPAAGKPAQQPAQAPANGKEKK
ncbi:MAG TPA: anti-sigma factor [Bryobacteraceae bacterium]|nr:anti-sigma factor [Bryobacteraceae bacterium]